MLQDALTLSRNLKYPRATKVQMAYKLCKCCHSTYLERVVWLQIGSVCVIANLNRVADADDRGGVDCAAKLCTDPVEQICESRDLGVK